MTPLKAVTLATPDGVSRELRDTPGARKWIYERFGEKNFLALARERGDWVLVEVAYRMMFDQKGNPPKDLTLDQLMENSSAAADGSELFGAVMSAVSNGVRPKNEIEALLKEAMLAAERMEMEKLTGLTSGLSLPSASDSQTISSGGDIPSSNSTPESSDTTSKST